jgi:formylglycine-generating enzyme required for sulfatase activity
MKPMHFPLILFSVLCTAVACNRKTPTVINDKMPLVLTMPDPEPDQRRQCSLQVLRATVTQTFREIQPGTFIMGNGHLSDMKIKDAPPHRVTLTKPFWLATTECTQQLWLTVMNSDLKTKPKSRPSRFSDVRPGHELEAMNRPVEMVSWLDCQEFIARLNELAAKSRLEYTFRLPTEAEWEYACRCPEKPPTASDWERVSRTGMQEKLPRYYLGNDGRAYNASLGDLARFGANSAPKENNELKANRTWEVNDRFANLWGFKGMLGNVAEWCQDACNADPFKGIETDTYVDGIVDPLCAKGNCHIFRGGAWDSLSQQCTSSWREGMFADYKNSNLGLRLVMVDIPKPIPAPASPATKPETRPAN